MTLIELSVGPNDYARGKGIRIVFLCIYMSLWRKEPGKWSFSGSVFYNMPKLSWRFTNA